jgi:hypothetical protein
VDDRGSRLERIDLNCTAFVQGNSEIKVDQWRFAV